ncbi:nicotinamide riboside transporter PnuC [Flavihumibacter petaseus]|uniref:Nicotinamide riboside transporter PnuC n=1 Tax=Flavihumibacter petaseus NBRC 106054 TaxID=1220578 RepID=A0A0E9N3B5_9BACT|nr:nicotinamide riboside transporter PnuC [Flavihumibacter petaseus]GAO44161.1 putative PnuC family transporter [Flavihumibacter petaseus NBRC 106054]
MSFSDWLSLLSQQILATDLLQWTAIILSVAEVLLARANKVWLYPTGIVATVISIYILTKAGLYAESLLNGYYVVMSIYGWWYWVKKQDNHPVTITRSTAAEWRITTAISLLGCAALYFLLRHFTDSTVPLWDAWVSSTAWAGMWLLARRKLENWILLNISNAFAIPLLFHKDLPLYALLTIFLFIVAVVGYLDWKRKLTHVLRANSKN